MIIFLKLYLESKYLFNFISIIKKYWSLFEMNVWNFLVNICHFFSDFAKNGRWNQAANIWLCSYFITESIQRKVQLLAVTWVWNKKLNGSIKNFLFSPKEWIFIQSIAYDNDHWHRQPISKKFFSVKRGNLTFENSSLIVGYSTVTEIINERPMYVMTNIMDAI